MKQIARVLAICLFAAAVVTVSDVLGAEQNPAAGTGSKRSTPGILLKSDPNDAVVREVIGRGRNRDEAVKDALYRAVEQVRGVRVDSSNYEFRFRGGGVGIRRSGIEFDFVDVATSGTVYTTKIAGLVGSYNVLDERQINENTYEVALEVSVYDYASRSRTERVKIALMPAKTLQDSYGFLNQIISGGTLSSLFSQRLVTGLTQTNKFAVLDRESISDFAKEREMLVSFDAPLREQAKLSETLGADYLLVGTISQAKIERIDTYLKAANYTTRKFKARFNFNFRLVDSATKQVVLASAAEKYLENEEVRKLADEQNPAEWDPSQVRDAFISLVVNDVIEAIIDRVYPVTVAAVQPDGQIILNQGGQRMTKGMLLEVYGEGKEIFDVDTGESLGKVESRVAMIEVQRVTHTMSFAKVVVGDAASISEGLVCRVKVGKKKPGVGTTPDITKTKSGGVKLPFDR